MATLALMAAGSWAASSLFGASTLFGMSAAAIGGTVGALAGAVVDSYLFGTKTSTTSAKADLSLTTSTEGAAIPRLYGRQRMSGQILWATKYLETETSETTGGGKGGSSVTTTSYSYSISVAVGLCEGPIGRVERIWADGNDLDLSDVTWRFYPGSETQVPDPLIEEIEGTGNTPAYRGLAYVVFEDLALEDFGNRIPQFQFEVVRPIGVEHDDTLETLARAVTIIPGSGRFVYSTSEVKRTEDGDTETENKINPTDVTDFVCSLDQLEQVLPKAEAAGLVVSWYGTDLRAGSCAILPGIDVDAATFDGGTWTVGGYGISTAHRLSVDADGNANYGATPADDSVTQAIAELKARDKAILFYPFVMMDIVAGNGLPDPWGGTEQAAFPWRGRISCHPAPGVAGSVDGTAAAATQVAAFFTAYRPMVLHYASLCAAAGGVDAFLIGSELVGLTTVRDASGAYPAVAALRTLAADVRAILGTSTKIGYAADWSEYHSHRPSDGSGDVLFPLDDLWSDDDIDFVGIDNYLPLSDWRDGEDHLDWAPMRRITDRDYLDANVEGGEYFDWYYASDGDREAQTRSAITDGAHGEPWIYRNKDIRSWWSSAHHARPSGVRSETATAWVPKSKPIWFTELGCPAIDKGPNQPNVFVDEKSSESATPHFSNGWRDDLVQRRALETVLAHWADEDVNPASDVYSGRMIDADRIFLWCWDARPFPWFPSSTDVWSDGENWRRGHWLNGRAGLAPIELVVADLCARPGVTAIDTADLAGLVTGYLIESVESARSSIEPLGQVFFFDGVESEAVIAFRRRDRAPAAAIVDDGFAVEDDGTQVYELTRSQETDLPQAVHLQYTEAAADYRTANAYGRRRAGGSVRETSVSVPFVMEQADAAGVAESMLIDAWIGREAATFKLPPSALALEPTDVVDATLGGRDWTLRLTSLADGTSRSAEATRTHRSAYQVVPGATRPYGAAAGSSSATPKATTGKAVLVLMDLPFLSSSDTGEVGPVLAAYARPWREVLVYRSLGDGEATLDTTLSTRATMGVTTAAFARGPVAVWDRANTLSIRLYGSGEVASASDLAVLAGANALAIETESGVWEIVQFATATLTGSRTWDLTRLLRGQLGTDGAIRDEVAAGARVVVLTSACARSPRTEDQIGVTYTWTWGPSGSAIAGSDFQSTTKAVTGPGLKPFSPAQVKGRRDAASGDVAFSWVRRARKNGDGWDQIEVPLDEASEAYELDILDGATVKRTIAVSSPAATWTAAEQIEDFGAAPSSVSVAVYQISQTVGRGTGRATTITL